MRSHEWFLEHRTDYATGVLDSDDTATFESHLRNCEECRREIERIEGELRWLPMAVDPVAPRPGLRRRIIQHVLEAGASRGHRLRAPAALAASVLLALGGWYVGSQRSRALEAEIVAQQVRVAALEDTLAIMHRAGRVLQATVQVDSRHGGLIIFADEVTHRWNVVVHGLPPAPPGQRYQFWFISADGMVRGAEVRLDRGSKMFTTGMPEGVGAVMGAALTVEPLQSTAGPPQGKELAHLIL
ncbi:MAG: anti-sigma factor [Gemmatimonadales bacterium]|nr:anti-sigma factor [Gemmatimonadales bacterium]